MAEVIIGKARVSGIDFADVITSAEDTSTATWEEQPLTLRDDVVELVESESTEEELYSHENDTPEDVDFIGAAIALTGSFIKMSHAQLVSTLGGSVDGTGESARYMHASKKLVINKAVRLRLKGGGTIIIPNCKGVVLLNLGLGFGGVAKYPFRLKPLASKITDANGDPVDLIFE